MISESKKKPMSKVGTLRTTVRVESQRFKTIKINNEPQIIRRLIWLTLMMLIYLLSSFTSEFKDLVNSQVVTIVLLVSSNQLLTFTSLTKRRLLNGQDSLNNRIIWDPRKSSQTKTLNPSSKRVQQPWTILVRTFAIFVIKFTRIERRLLDTWGSVTQKRICCTATCVHKFIEESAIWSFTCKVSTWRSMIIFATFVTTLSLHILLLHAICAIRALKSTK